MRKWVASNRGITLVLAACAASSGLLYLALLFADTFWQMVAMGFAIMVIVPPTLALSVFLAANVLALVIAVGLRVIGARPEPKKRASEDAL